MNTCPMCNKEVSSHPSSKYVWCVNRACALYNVTLQKKEMPKVQTTISAARLEGFEMARIKSKLALEDVSRIKRNLLSERELSENEFAVAGAALTMAERRINEMKMDGEQ